MFAAGASDAEIHYFQGIEYYMHKQYDAAILEFSKAIKLKSNYAEAQSAFKVAYAKLEDNDSQGNTASLGKSLGYGCLGGGLGGGLGCLVGDEMGYDYDDSAFFYGMVGSTILGSAIGAYWGSRDVDTTWKRGCYIGGTVVIVTWVTIKIYRIYEAFVQH